MRARCSCGYLDEPGSPGDVDAESPSFAPPLRVPHHDLVARPPVLEPQPHGEARPGVGHARPHAQRVASLEPEAEHGLERRPDLLMPFRESRAAIAGIAARGRRDQPPVSQLDVQRGHRAVRRAEDGKEIHAPCPSRRSGLHVSPRWRSARLCKPPPSPRPDPVLPYARKRRDEVPGEDPARVPEIRRHRHGAGHLPPEPVPRRCGHVTDFWPHHHLQLDDDRPFEHDLHDGTPLRHLPAEVGRSSRRG